MVIPEVLKSHSCRWRHSVASPLWFGCKFCVYLREEEEEEKIQCRCFSVLFGDSRSYSLVGGGTKCVEGDEVCESHYLVQR